MAAPVPDSAVIRLLGFASDAVDVDFDALVVEVAGIGGGNRRFFFVNAALCIGLGVARQQACCQS
jgi:hypothetical protein